MGDYFDYQESRMHRSWDRTIDRIEAREEARARMAKGSIDPTARNTSVGKLITPEQIAAGGSEHAHQAAFFQWIALYGSKVMGDTEMLFAIPNGGDRRASVAASLKAEGVKSGVPDVCWPIPRKTPWADYHGLWMELKKPSEQGKRGGGRSDTQIKWHDMLIEKGYFVALVYGWQAMAWVAKMYREGELRMPNSGVFIATETKRPPVDEPPHV